MENSGNFRQILFVIFLVIFKRTVLFTKVTVTLPISDTKKVLVVLLHVPVQRIEIVRRKRTEGAQQSLLCVHTSNVGIHP